MTMMLPCMAEDRDTWHRSINPLIQERKLIHIKDGAYASGGVIPEGAGCNCDRNVLRSAVVEVDDIDLEALVGVHILVEYHLAVADHSGIFHIVQHLFGRGYAVRLVPVGEHHQDVADVLC